MAKHNRAWHDLHDAALAERAAKREVRAPQPPPEIERPIDKHDRRIEQRARGRLTGDY